MSTRVLVADDSSTMRKIILRSLQAVGVPNAVEAADG
jgi:two-component system chemotaxis response regulator CheY